MCVYCNLLHSNSFVGNNYVAAVYKAVGTFLFGAAASQSLTDIAKYSVGRLRPHFLDICDPDWAKINCSDGYIENYVCRGDAQKVKEGRCVGLRAGTLHALADPDRRRGSPAAPRGALGALAVSQKDPGPGFLLIPVPRHGPACVPIAALEGAAVSRRPPV